jgi:Zn-dependent protease
VPAFDLATAVPAFIVVLLSLTVHEFSHAWSAYRLGDDTAARMGRLTLNPIPHIDLIGTIVLPLTLAFAGLPTFGWAKPVPVNPANFRRNIRMSVGDTIVSLAGPCSNILLAVLAAVAMGVAGRFMPLEAVKETAGGKFLGALVATNVLLAIFNVIPVPPLDGSHLVGHLLPQRMREGWELFRRFGPLVLLALLYIPVGREHTPILWHVLEPVGNFVLNLLDNLTQGLAA